MMRTKIYIVCTAILLLGASAGTFRSLRAQQPNLPPAETTSEAPSPDAASPSLRPTPRATDAAALPESDGFGAGDFPKNIPDTAPADSSAPRPHTDPPTLRTSTHSAADPLVSGDNPAIKPSPAPPGTSTPNPNAGSLPAAAPVVSWFTSQSSQQHVGVASDDDGLAKLRQADLAMDRQAEELVAAYAATEDAGKRADLTKQLQELLEKHFSVQQQIRQRELAPIEARVKKLRELIDRRHQAQREIVQQRLDQLLREADGLGWTQSGNVLSVRSFSPTDYRQRRGDGVHIIGPSRGLPSGSTEPTLPAVQR